MTKFDDIYEEAADNFGLISSSRARELRITNNELIQYARRGRVERVGQGLYRLTRRIPENNDTYALAVALVGSDDYLFGESVITMHNLAPINSKFVNVTTPSRVLRRLSTFFRLTDRRPGSDLKVYEGIPSQSIAAAIRSCKGLMMPDKLEAAARNARSEGLILKDTENVLLEELMS